MKRGRAFRRHHRNRRFKAEYKKWLICGDEEHALNSARAFVDRRTPCSCTMCGNPRNHFGYQTIQEKKADYSAKEQLDKVGKKFYSRFTKD